MGKEKLPWQSDWVDWVSAIILLFFSVVLCFGRYPIVAVICAFCSGYGFHRLFICYGAKVLRDVYDMDKERAIEEVVKYIEGKP